jgi:hypothetical protein
MAASSPRRSPRPSSAQPSPGPSPRPRTRTSSVASSPRTPGRATPRRLADPQDEPPANNAELAWSTCLTSLLSLQARPHAGLTISSAVSTPAGRCNRRLQGEA